MSMKYMKSWWEMGEITKIDFRDYKLTRSSDFVVASVFVQKKCEFSFSLYYSIYLY